MVLYICMRVCTYLLSFGISCITAGFETVIQSMAGPGAEIQGSRGGVRS